MKMTTQNCEQQIKDFAQQLGFSHIGICQVQSDEQVPNLKDWLHQNYHGTMQYMENPKRHSATAALDGVRTMIVVALNYRWPDECDQPQEGMISKYAWSTDYHNVMKPMLERMAEFIRELQPEASTKVYVDTGPIVEKYWAQKAGIGWIGKHTNVLSKRGSSWLFLGVVLTDLDLVPDTVASNHCGSCERCIEACPTRAIIAPYVLDARLCISYLTIELRDSIPRELRSLIGNRIFGCDDCQDVCPWNRFAFVGDPRFTPKPEMFSATLSDYLRLSSEEFRLRFAGTNVLRAKYRGFIRNCLVAAGNVKRPELKGDIVRHLGSDDEMIREHAVWALAQFQDEESRSLLQQHKQKETSPKVLEELAWSAG